MDKETIDKIIEILFMPCENEADVKIVYTFAKQAVIEQSKRRRKQIEAMNAQFESGSSLPGYVHRKSTYPMMIDEEFERRMNIREDMGR